MERIVQTSEQQEVLLSIQEPRSITGWDQIILEATRRAMPTAFDLTIMRIWTPSLRQSKAFPMTQEGMHSAVAFLDQYLPRL